MPTVAQLRDLADRARGARRAVEFALQDNGTALMRQPRFPPRLEDAAAWLRIIFAGCDDIVFREFQVGRREPVNAVAVFADGLVDSQLLQNSVLRPLMYEAGLDRPAGLPDLAGAIQRLALVVSEVRTLSSPEDVAAEVFKGSVALLLDGEDRAVMLTAPGWSERSVEKPEHKAVLRGPKDSFIENARANLAMLRRRLSAPEVKVKRLRIGSVTKTEVAVVHHQRLADPALVAEVVGRLEAVEVDGITDSGMLEQLISDKPLSIFPTIQESERPDEVVAALLEGRVAIVVDNTPFVLLVPATLSNMMMAPEDYYIRWPVATFVRVMRYIAAMVAMTLPSLYVVLTSFHPEVLPVELGVFMGGGREGRPFSVISEVFLMEITMEILREATIRLPGAFGQAISVVGTLVVGQAAVRAGLVSPVVIIVTGATAVASFAVPAITLGFAIRLLRFPLMLLSGTFGLPGLFAGLYMILVHLICLRSFGLEYLAPVAPMFWRDLGDAVLRLPWRFLRRRPFEYHARDEDRSADGGTG